MRSRKFKSMSSPNLCSFIKALLSHKDILEQALSNRNIGNLLEVLDDFVYEVGEEMKKHPLFAYSLEESKSKVRDYIVGRLFKMFYVKLDPTSIDKEISQKCELLKEFPPERFGVTQSIKDTHGIGEKFVYEKMKNSVNSTFLRFEKARTPKKKLEALYACTQAICLTYKIVNLKGQEADADSLQPILTLIISAAGFEKLDSNIRFVRLFYEGNLDMDQNGFVLAQLQLAAKFIQNEDLDAE